MVQSSIFQHDDVAGWETVGEGVQRQVLGYDDKVMLVRVKFERGGYGEPHSHEHSQASYVESGAFEMTIGDEKKIIRAGDGYYVPPFTIHGCVCVEAGILVDAFSPCRLDFIASR